MLLFGASGVGFFEPPRNHLARNLKPINLNSHSKVLKLVIKLISTYGTAVPIALASLLAIAMATSDKTGALPPSSA